MQTARGLVNRKKEVVASFIFSTERYGSDDTRTRDLQMMSTYFLHIQMTDAIFSANVDKICISHFNLGFANDAHLSGAKWER